MKAWKKAMALALAVLLCLSFAACGGGDNGEDASGGTYVILDESLAAEQYGIGFRKGDVLCDQVNAALQVMAADGTLAEISDKWFGTDITTVTPDENALDGMDIQPRTFILGLDDSFPPMGFRDTETNEIVGFDIDVATAMCEMLDWELQVQPIDWASNTMELNAGNVDCLWNGMTLTEERLEAMSCSIPYMENEQVLVVMSDSGIQSKADLAGKTLALQAGSSAEEALESDTEFMNSLGSINRFEDNMLALMDLEQGSSDAVLVDSIVANYYIASNQ